MDFKPFIGQAIYEALTVIPFFSINRVERSSDQVVKPINLEALSKWVGQIPEDVVNDMAEIAPMLSTLGYDPNANPPNYGDPDQWVANNTLNVARQSGHWLNKTQHLLKGKKEQQQVVKDNEDLLEN